MMFKLTKNIASTVLSLAIVGMVYLFVADTYKWWPFESVTETVKIDETPNVVTEIRGIKKFTTACYYGDVTISKEKASDNWLKNLLRQRDRICLIGRGTIRAGYDFEKLPADAVKISGDTQWRCSTPSATRKTVRCLSTTATGPTTGCNRFTPTCKTCWWTML